MSDNKLITGKQEYSKRISIALTTYAHDTYYTHACLEAIRSWKTKRHEVLVACHDPSPLLEFYLRACEEEGLIDRLIFTPSEYGHTKGVNLCFDYATGDVLFNIANDIIIGPSIVDDCAYKLQNNKQLGLIGWHWYSDGTFWNNNKINSYRLRDDTKPDMSDVDEANIRKAPWFTGKAFEALGGPKWIHLCNTGFFGIRKELWKKIGGFSTTYRHYWADDFLNYAVLDQGLDISNFEPKFRKSCYFHEFQYSNVDVDDRHRHDDVIKLPEPLQESLTALEGGMSISEGQLLYQVARSVKEGNTVLNVGLWRGASLFIFMEAAKNKEMKFIGIDCFDLPDISVMSGQSPVTRDEVVSYMQPFIGEKHTIQLMKADTLKLNLFPKAHVIFLDAGHTKQCIENDIKLAKQAIVPGGMIIFHDYNQPMWPDVKVVIDANFPKEKIKVFNTLAIVEM